jgi:hypothetical protein
MHSYDDDSSERRHEHEKALKGDPMLKTTCFAILALSLLVVAVAPAAACPDRKHLPDGIVSVDTYRPPELQQMIHDGYAPEVSWLDAFGEFVDVDAYVPDLTVAEAWDYVQDIYNLPNWTISLRDLTAMGTLNGLNRYAAIEHMPPGAPIYMLEQKHPQLHTVDWWVGLDPNDIWMHYYLRILDAQTYVGKPGIIINWVNFGNAKFDQNPDLKNGFLGMRIAHAIERDNLVKILRWRAAGNTGAIDTAVRQQLGLVDIETTDTMTLWNAVISQITPTVTWDNLYGQFISSHFYLPNVPAEDAWAFVSNPRNMERWTVSTRHVRMTCGGDFVAEEMLSPHGPLAADVDLDQESKTMDLRMSNAALAQHLGKAKWMTSSIRVLDGPQSVGKPGSVVVWTTFHHAAYDKLPSLADEWKYLPVRNKLAAGNVKLWLAQP